MEEADRTGRQEEPADWHDRLGASLREDESVAVSRKKVLLRLLAVRECARLGIGLTSQEAAAAVADFRRRFGLEAEQDLEEWLTSTGTSRGEFERFVTEITLVEALEAHLAPEIARGLPVQRAARTAYAWNGEVWVQFNVELRRDTEGRAAASAVRCFEALWALVDPLTRPADVTRFFAMRKPPGLRLRFAGRRIAPIRSLVGGLLDSLAREGPVVSWSAVPYEPETPRFGGASGLELAHRWFETDSLVWFRYEGLALRGEARVERDTLSCAALNHLFLTVVRDAAEVWDIWHRLAALHRPPAGLAAGATAGRAAQDLEALRARAGGQELAILSSYERANLQLADGLTLAAHESRLTVGTREFLATLALFHWNRFGLPPATRHAVLGSMLRALDPAAADQASAGPSTA